MGILIAGLAVAVLVISVLIMFGLHEIHKSIELLRRDLSERK